MLMRIHTCILSIFLLPLVAFSQTFFEYQHQMGGELKPYNAWEEVKFGAGTAAIGDLDGDGITEMAVGALGGNEAAGELWILFMNKDGSVKSTTRNTVGQGLPETVSSTGSFGIRLEALGDWDGDGVPDVAVSEPRALLGSTPYGTAWLVMLNKDGSVKTTVALHGQTAGLRAAIPTHFQFGSDIAMVGDIDGNGQGDLAIGAPGDVRKHTGEVYLLLMDDYKSIRALVAFTKSTPSLAKALSRGDQFGTSVEAAGDMNGDGIPDLWVGAPQDDESGTNQGAVYLLELDKRGFADKWHKVRNEKKGLEMALDFDDQWGTSLAHYEGYHGDSLRALAVGTPNDDDGSKDRGAIYVLGFDEKLKILSQEKISQKTPNFEGELPVQHFWGKAISPIGDLNEDGRPDLSVNGFTVERQRGSFWMLFPTAWPARLSQDLAWAPESDVVTAEDSAKIYEGAVTAADSARIDSMYDLSGYAPTHLIFVLDVSASMNHSSKLPILKDAFINLLPFLRPEDKVSIITYSGKAVLHLDGVTAKERGQIAKVLRGLKSEGATKPKKAVEMAYAQAEAHMIADGNNRIIFATDGGFIGSEVEKPLDKLASVEVPLTVFYFGKQGARQLKVMEGIARNGYGRIAQVTSGSVNEVLLREVKVIKKKDE